MELTSGIALRGEWVARRHDATGLLLSERRYRNTICLVGKAVVAAWLNQENPALGYWGAVGTGTGTPGSGDTQLWTELARVPLASTSRSANLTLIDFFFNTTTGNGSLTEAGCFLTATSAANSGQLLSHVLITENKVAGTTLTLEFALTIGP